MANLALLPAELLDGIFKATSTQSLTNTMLTCKALHRSAMPFLYKEIHFPQLESAGERRPPPVYLLLRSILRNPDLAARVKAINIGASCYGLSGAIDLKSPTLDAEDLQRAVEFLTAAKIPDAGNWRKALESGSIRPIVALLLSQLSNLQQLHLSVDVMDENRYLETVFRCALTAPPSARIARFDHLRVIDFGRSLYEDEQPSSPCLLSIDLTALISLLPNLQNATLIRPGLGKNSSTRMFGGILSSGSVPPSHLVKVTGTALTTLDLWQASISPAELKNITAHTPHLRRLNYHGVFELSQSLDANELQAALLNVHKTLEHLTIEFKTWSGRQFAVGIKNLLPNALGSLRELKRLLTLEVGYAVLLGVHPRISPSLSDVLPQSLRLLVLRDDGAEFRDWTWPPELAVNKINGYVENWRAVTPRLERLNLCLMSYLGSKRLWTHADLDSVREKCEMKELDLGYRQYWP